MFACSIRLSVMFARRAVALGEGEWEVAVEVAVAVEVEAEAEAEVEAEAEAGEKQDQYRKLREQNEVTERGGLGAHRGRGLCCSGAGKAFWWPRSWTFGLGRRAGRQVGQATQARQAWEVGLLELGCSQEQARSCSTGVGKVPSQTPTPRPSSKPTSEHPIPSRRASLDSRKRARRGRESGDRGLSLVFRRRGQGTIRSSSCKTKKARCDVLLQEQNEGAQRRGGAAQRGAAQRGAAQSREKVWLHRISRIFAVVCSFALAALQTQPARACLPPCLSALHSEL